VTVVRPAPASPAIPVSRLGRTQLTVTKLGFGGAPIGNLFTAVTERDAAEALQASYEAGIRYFDTAPLYGHGLSERRSGKFLGRHPRASYVLSSKVGRVLEPATPAAIRNDGYVATLPFSPRFDYSYDGAMRSVEESLNRLGTDRLDIALIHDVDVHTHGDRQQESFDTAMKGAYRALSRLRDEGAVAAIGLGVNEWQVCVAAAEAGDFDCFLLAGRYSLLEQESLDRFFPVCAERGIGVIIGGVFNSGILATGAVPGAKFNYRDAPPPVMDKVRRLEAVCAAHRVPLAAAALQFVAGHPLVSSVVLGMRSSGEVARNTALMRVAIPKDFWSELAAERLIRADAPVPSG
jgi:D-threo-aldose 1-dehydrogenase